MANRVDPDEMARYDRLIWIYTVCIGISTGLEGIRLTIQNEHL